MFGILKYNKYQVYTEWIIATILLLIGCTIYLLFRPQNLLMFKIIEELGFMPNIVSLRMYVNPNCFPDFIIYSLPAGLWIASYFMMMYLTTKGYTRKSRLMLTLPLPITAIVLEFMQLLGLYIGTFDAYDLICYTLPLIFFVKSIK